MDKKSNDIVTRFLEGKKISDPELLLLENLLFNSKYKEELYDILIKYWHESPSKPTGLTFEEIRKNLKSSLNNKKSRIISTIAKAAAILLIPIIIASLYFYSNRNESNELLTLTTQRGEVTNVILPDGSRVWLNVDSKLSFPVKYGIKSRNLKLEGEAYFEVKKNKLPLKVNSGLITTTALGTRFVVSAYPESRMLSSSLLEGSVRIDIGDKHKIMIPGQQLVIEKDKNLYAVKSFNEEYILAWKNNQLVFQLTPFDSVISELEKWYDIKIIYNPASFSSDTLTVRFEKYESMENVLKVISRAVGFEYKVDNNIIKISKMIS